MHLYGGDGTLLYAVPYDFDMSGMINAPYASPNPRFRLSSVRERLYRGRCDHNEHVPDTFQLFQDRREAFYALAAAESGLSSASRRSMNRYLDMFYKIIEKPANLESRFFKACVLTS